MTATPSGELRTLVLEKLHDEKRIHYEEVTVPEWDDAVVRVRVMESDDRDWFEQTIHNATKNGKVAAHFRAMVLVVTICDEKGQRIFKEHEAAKIGKLPSDGVDRVFDVAARLNGLSKDAGEEAEKNSESETTSECGSVSQDTSECPSPDANGK